MSKGEFRSELLRAEPPKAAPVVDGLQIGVHYQPSAATVGAFHEFVDLGAGRLAVFVADVSGPPSSGALIVKRMRELLQSHDSLHDVFVRMNRELSGDALRGTFVTLFAVRIDTASSTLKLCSAGHNAMIFVTPRSRDPEFVNTRGLAMGIDRGPQFESMVSEQTLAFEPGDRLLLYTDGLRKMANPGGHEYGAERLAERFQELGERECHDILSALHSGLTSFRGGMIPVDDFVLICLRRLPTAKRAAEPETPARTPLEEHLDTSLMQIQELKRRLRTEQEKIDKDKQEGVRQIHELRELLEQALQKAENAGRIEQVLEDRKHVEEQLAQLRLELDKTKQSVPDVKRYQEQIDALKKMVADLQSALDAATHRSAELDKAKKSSKRLEQETAKKVAALSDELKARTAELAGLKSQLDSKTSQAQAGQETIDELKGQAEQVQRRLATFEKEAAAKTTELEALRNQLQELQTLRGKADQAGVLEKKIVDLTGRLEEQRQKAAEAETVKRQLHELQSRADAAGILEKKLVDLTGQLEEQSKKADEIESLKKQLQGLRGHADQAGDLEKKIVELTGRLEEQGKKASQVEALEKKISELQQELGQARQSGEAAAAEKEKRLWQEVVQREGRIADLQRELEKFRKESDGLKGMTAVMGQLKHDLEQEIRARDATIKEREEHVRKLQGLLAKQGEEAEAKIQELTAKLSSVKPLLMRAQEEIKEKTAKLDQLEKTQSTKLSLPNIQTGAQPVAPPPPTTRIEPKKPETQRANPRFMKTMRAPIPVVKPPAATPPAKGDSTKSIPPEPETMASGLVRMPDVQFTLSRSRFGLRKTLSVAHLRGISEKTLAATVSEPLDEGTSVHIKLYVKKFGDTIEMDGTVIDQSILTMNELFEITVLFDKISDVDKRRLANALSYYSSDAGRAQH
jgi:uncharacterized coiled-coil DUF342 family protein